MDITVISDNLYTRKGSAIRGFAKALREKGNTVKVIIPLYGSEYNLSKIKFTMLGNYFVHLPNGNYNITLYCARVDDITCYFISNPRLFGRERPWGYHDDGLRSAVFSISALESMNFINSYPEYIFTDSSNTALVPVYLKLKYSADPKYKSIKSYHYINSTDYGIYDRSLATGIMGISGDDIHLLQCGTDINLTKAAIICSNRVFVGENAVNLLYSNRSVLHHTVVQFGFKFRKLRMGLDYSIYSPETDQDIHKNFSSENITGKHENKQILQRYCDLEERKDVPLIALYADNNKTALTRVLKDMLRCDLQIIVVKDNIKQSELPCAPKKIAAVSGNSAEILKNIFAGSDYAIFSSFNSKCGNPCYIASAYGCIPIVASHRFFDYGISYYNKITKEGNGYTYDPNIPQDLLYTLWDGLGIYRHDQKCFSKLLKNTMEKAFSASNTVETIMKEAEKAVCKI